MKIFRTDAHNLLSQNTIGTEFCAVCVIFLALLSEHVGTCLTTVGGTNVVGHKKKLV